MRSPADEAPRTAHELRLEHRLWLHRRLARGLAHELANLQQMLLLPEPPPEMRDELDARLVALVETLARVARETNDDPPPATIVAADAWHEAARAHDRLGGEPRVRWTVVQPPAPLRVTVRPDALQRALVTALVLAARALDRQSNTFAELRVEGGGAVEFVAEVSSTAPPEGDEERWLAACAETWLAAEHGALRRERGTGRVRVIARVPAAS